MGYSNMASIYRTGDGIIRNLNSSLEVFCSGIAVDFNRHCSTDYVWEMKALASIRESRPQKVIGLTLGKLFFKSAHSLHNN